MSKKDLFHEEVEGRMEKLKQKPKLKFLKINIFYTKLLRGALKNKTTPKKKKKTRQQAKGLIKSSPLCLVW